MRVESTVAAGWASSRVARRRDLLGSGAATAVTLGGILLLVFTWMGIRAAVLAANCSAWGGSGAWSSQWSGGTAAP